MNIFKQTLEKMKQQQQVLLMLIFAFVAVIIWTAASLFTSQKKTGIEKELLKLATPLTPTINKEIIQELTQKKIFASSQLQDFPIYMVLKDKTQGERVVEIGAEPERSPQNASQSATLDATQSAIPEL